MDEVKQNKDEDRHIKNLSQYLEKFHLATGFQNKEVAELLKMDKSYYNKIRLKKFSPISNSISILKKFASLNNKSIIQFIAEIEEIELDQNILELNDEDWQYIIKKVFIDVGPVVRKLLIQDRIKDILDNDEKYIDTLVKNFVLLLLIIDISKNEKWLNVILDLILNIHYNLEGDMTEDINVLVQRIKKS